jgi:hypothetical protein
VDIILSNIAHVAQSPSYKQARCSLDQAECLMNMILKVQAMLTGRAFDSKFARFITLCTSTGYRSDGAWMMNSHYVCSERPELHCTMTDFQIGRFQEFHTQDDQPSSWEEICGAKTRAELYAALDCRPKSCVWRSVSRRRRSKGGKSRWETASQMRIAYSSLRVSLVSIQ